MPILHIKKHDEKYSIIHNSGAQNPKLSMKAKGLLWYLLTLPDDWEIHQTELLRHFKDKRDAIRSAINELVEYGYIVKIEFHNDRGRFQTEYFVFEAPPTQEVIEELRKPFKDREVHRVGFSATVKPPRKTRVGKSDTTKRLIKEKTKNNKAGPQKSSQAVPLDKSWDLVKTGLQNRINPPSFNQWLKPIERIDFSENTYTLYVPTETHKTWLEDNYRSIVAEEIQQKTGVRFIPEHIHFEVQPD